jgi:hypothetical protein
MRRVRPPGFVCQIGRRVSFAEFRPPVETGGWNFGKSAFADCTRAPSRTAGTVAHPTRTGSRLLHDKQLRGQGKESAHNSGSGAVPSFERTPALAHSRTCSRWLAAAALPAPHLTGGSGTATEGL